MPARRRVLMLGAAVGSLLAACTAPLPLDAPPVAELRFQNNRRREAKRDAREKLVGDAE